MGGGGDLGEGGVLLLRVCEMATAPVDFDAVHVPAATHVRVHVTHSSVRTHGVRSRRTTSDRNRATASGSETTLCCVCEWGMGSHDAMVLASLE